MDRRRFLLTSMAGALAAPLELMAQPARVPRVAVYLGALLRDELVDALREHGWVVGRSLVVDWRSEEGSESHMTEHLAKAPADVLIVGGPHRIRAAMQATTTIPIIAIDLESDPVAQGFVQTLARPGRNVTGIWMDLPEIAGKQIQFLRELVPSLNRIGVVWEDRIGQPQFAELQAVSRAAGIQLIPAALHVTTEIDDVMKRLVTKRPQAIVLLTAPVVFLSLGRIAELAIQSRVPSISPFSPYPGRGGLMAYGPDFPAMWRQLGSYVDRVLRGARAGELPVERPSKFSLVINLKTAKALGLTIPPPLLARADQVIE
jgi:putative ABC transport system substrate-binding protein